jgi:hypothetical protein
MALGLTAGREERMDGAPDPILNLQEERVQAIIAHLMAKDTDGALFQGDPANARDLAVRLMNEEAWKHADEQKAAARQAASQASADRRAQRAAARGVVPEDLPADEFGNVSPRTVQDANKPLDVQEAELEQYQGVAAAEIRDLREGRFHGAAAQQRQYAQDYGLGAERSRTGKTDLDYLREQQEHQGFLRTGRGELIPMGPAPTPENIESRRVFDEWANQTPGTTRQQLYDPAAYETHREGVRQDIQDRARADAAAYGTGNESQLKERVQAGDPVAEEQYDRRVERKQSEDRVIKSDWQTRRRMERLAMRDHGDPARARSELDAALAERDKDLSPEERFMEQKRRGGNLGRIADQEARRDLVREQAMLAGGQPTGGPGGTRATTNAINQLGPGWREIAMLDRLTQGRVGGPTPLGVQAANMENSIPVIRSILAGAAQGLDPASQEDRRLTREMQLAQMPPAERVALSIQNGEPMGTGLSAAHVGARWNHWTNNMGPRPASWRDQNFRMEMEGLGYAPGEIDTWIASRREADPAPPPRAPRQGRGVSPRGRRRNAGEATP